VDKFIHLIFIHFTIVNKQRVTGGCFTTNLKLMCDRVANKLALLKLAVSFFKCITTLCYSLKR